MRPLWYVLLVLLGAAGIAHSGIAGGRADAGALTQIEFSLDRPIDAAVAPVVLASTRGLFSAEGLNVTTMAATDTADAIARVAAGTSELALADFNALIRFRDQPGVQPIKAVFVLFDKTAYAFIARKSRGINTLADIEGKTVGVTDGDLSIRLWPALARRNGLKLKAVKLQQIGPAVREPMLSAGQLDAISGFIGPLGDRPAQSRYPGRRYRRAAICRLRLRRLWQGPDRQSGIRTEDRKR